jgi:methanethiol S-methyltransferase
MLRKVFFLYGVFAHVLFLVVYAWMAAFVGNFGFDRIPTIDAPAVDPLPYALLINVLLAALFGVQHSVMARPTFKKWWTGIIPEPIERSTYVLFSNLIMILLLWQWRPLGGVVWDVTQPAARWGLHGLFAIGWVMVPAVSLLINHFDLFGTRQVYLHLRNRPYTDLPFREPAIYRHVRHPLYVGWLIAFWATPTMSVTHLLFAVLMTAYILIAIPFEERNLMERFGRGYADYRARVGGLIPRLPCAARSEARAATSRGSVQS